MGVVYKARDRRLNRAVALKFVADDRTGSEETLRRFRREAESIASLNHPNIATLYEVGEWAGEPFLAMEFLSGGPLTARRVPGGCGYEELCRYAAELGGGLHFAHTRGILHRDVKPANGMFSEHDVLKLVDFGLAKPRRTADITRSGAPLGTIGFMAPELLRGQDASAASDLYALGATLYELAAGRPMYSAASVGELVERVLRAQPEPLASLRPDLPEWFAEAIGRATAADPRERFASVQGFVESLTSADVSLTTQTVLPQRIAGYGGARASRKAEPKIRRRMIIPAAVAIVATAVGLALLTGVPFRTLLTHRSATPVMPPEQVLVVLPFENLGGNPANQPLCEGLQETVTGLLSMAGRAGNLLVVPSAEVRRSQVRSIAEARKLFRADLALTGSAQEAAGKLRLTLNLDDAIKLRQKDSRIILAADTEIADLQDKLAIELGSLLGFASPAQSGARAPGETTTNSLAYSLYLEGTGAVENRDTDAAMGFLRKALQADPAFVPARAKLAEAYLWRNTFSKDPKWLELADEELNRAGGSGRETLMARAMIRKATGDLDAATQLFRQLTKSDPRDVEAYQLLAQTLSQANRPAEAEATLQQAIRLRPGYWPLHNALGIFYLDRQDYTRSERAFLAAATVAPDAAIVYSNLGAVYFRTKRWKEAEANFEKSLTIRPNALAHANLSAICFYEGRYEEASNHARMSTQMQPANPLNWGNLGDALWPLPSRREEARAAFAQAALLSGEQLAINPDDWRLRRSYALFLAKLGRTSEAVTQIGIALSRAPGDKDVQFYAARVFAVAGETSRARAALARCQALGCSAEEIDREPDLAAIRAGRQYERNENK
jgi:tetratricopeptide (TPR) repeat protein